MGLIQGDRQAAAIGFNPDGSRLGKLLSGEGFEVDVGVGDFDGDTRFPEVVFAYRALDSTLKTEVLDVFGNRLETARAGECRETRLAVGNFSDDRNAKYAVSLSQSDATTAEVTFAALAVPREGRMASALHRQGALAHNNAGQGDTATRESLAVGLQVVRGSAGNSP